MRMFVLALAMCGCGPDPRLDFVGGWKGTLLETAISNGGTPATRSYSAAFAISAPENSRVLQFEWWCKFTATTSDGQNIKIDPIICPFGRKETYSGAMADFADDFQTSSGKLINDTLTLELRGSRIGSNYSDNPSATYRWALEIKISASRK